MYIKDEKLGIVEVEIKIEKAAVDSYIVRGWREFNGFPLSDEELDYLQNTYEAEVQEYAYENGSRNHN